MQTHQVAALAAAPSAKFSDVLLHWTASNLDGDWQTVVRDVLKNVDDLLEFTISANNITIAANGSCIELHVRNKRARGTIRKGKSAWLLALCLVKLSRHLAITIVDDDSITVDRRYLNSRLDALCVSVDEFEDAAEKLGLISNKAFAQNNHFVANFF